MVRSPVSVWGFVPALQGQAVAAGTGGNWHLPLDACVGSWQECCSSSADRVPRHAQCGRGGVPFPGLDRALTSPALCVLRTAAAGGEAEEQQQEEEEESEDEDEDMDEEDDFSE